MPYGYIGQNTPNQTVSSLEKQGKFGGSLELIAEASYSSDVTYIDFTSIQETKYDVHLFEYRNLKINANSGNYGFQFYESGVLETASVYQYAEQVGSTQAFAEFKSTSDTLATVGKSAATGGTTGKSVNGYVYLYNLGNSSKYSFVTHHSFNVDPYAGAGTVHSFRFGGAVLPQASTVDGFRFKGTTSADIQSYDIKLYGVKQL
jgi:hypothetical protein